MRAIGFVLIALGIAGLLYGGFTWTHKDKVVDLGAVEISRDKHETLPMPPLVGAVVLIAGVAMVLKPSHQ